MPPVPGMKRRTTPHQGFNPRLNGGYGSPVPWWFEWVLEATLHRCRSHREQRFQMGESSERSARKACEVAGP